MNKFFFTQGKNTEDDDDNIDRNCDYYVEKILAQKYNDKQNVNMYLIRWRKRKTS